MRNAVAIAALTIFAVSAVSAGGAQAGRIDGISPVAARAGEQVVISGIGFGGPNVTITVGGIPAKLVAATGNRAVFIVPEGVKPGVTTVDATNPGGHAGSIAFTFLEGTLLAGDPTKGVADVILDKSSPGVGGDDLLNGLILTRLEIVVTPDATVAELNAALEKVEGGIVASSKGLRDITIAVPRQESAADLDAIATTLEAMPGIRHAGTTTVPQAKFLYFPPTFDSVVVLRHLLPSRFPAAWNVANRLQTSDDPSGLCTVTPVNLLVADEFGSTPPAVFSKVPLFNPPATAPFGSIAPDELHGYEVGLVASASGIGANPVGGCVNEVLTQVAGFGINGTTDAIVANMPAGRFIINYSIGFPDNCALAACLPPSDRMPSATTRAYEGLDWKKKTKSRWHDFLIVAAAGNEADEESTAIYPGMGDARYGSQMEIAQVPDPLMSWAVDGKLWDPTLGFSSLGFTSLAASPTAYSSLVQEITDAQLTGPDAVADNVIVVGSATAAPRGTVLTQRVGPEQLSPSDFSDHNPDVLAVGENVFDAQELQGTSFAAPAVSGLAAYLWLLSPELENRGPATTKQAIVANARNNIIDAYASMLSLDAAATPDPSSAPIRRALLDVNQDGVFNELDLILFLQHLYFFDTNTNTITFEAPASTAADFSVFDLNGDGFTTSGSRRERFDLDRVGSTQFGAANYSIVTQSIEGEDVRFDENELTDVEILCYYAYSPMYQGDTDARKKLMAGRCGLAVDPPTVTLDPGHTQQFTVNAPSADPVTWTATCGNIDSNSGFYTAPSQGGTCTVRATSNVDSTQFAEATVTVNGAIGHFDLDTGFRAELRALVGTNLLFPDQELTASNSSTVNPPLPLLVKVTDVFNPSGGAPANYSFSAQADGPLPGRNDPDASGMFNGQVNCSGSGSAKKDADGNIIAAPAIPRLQPSTAGDLSGSVRTGTVTLTVNGQLTRSVTPASSSSENVSIEWNSAGGLSQAMLINANDFDPSMGVIPFSKTVTITAPGSFSVDWGADLDCRGSTDSDGNLSVNGKATVSFSYSLSN